MINTPPPQSPSHTRATLPVWYTSSQIESPVFSPPSWCNRTSSSQGTCPLFISTNKVLRANRRRQRLPKLIRRFRGQHGHSSARPPAEAVTIRVCAGLNLQQPECPYTSLCMTLSSPLLGPIIWPSQESPAAICQINTRLRLTTLLPPPTLPFFDLIRGLQICWMDDSTECNCGSKAGDDQAGFCSAAARLQPASGTFSCVPAANWATCCRLLITWKAEWGFELLMVFSQTWFSEARAILFDLAFVFLSFRISFPYSQVFSAQKEP